MATGPPDIISREPRPLAVAAIAVSGVLAGGLLGGSTNAVNGAVSPTYFVTILAWRGVEDVCAREHRPGDFRGIAVRHLLFVAIYRGHGDHHAGFLFVRIRVQALAGHPWRSVRLLGDGRPGCHRVGRPQPRVLSASLHRRAGGIRANAPLCVGGRFNLGRNWADSYRSWLAW